MPSLRPHRRSARRLRASKGFTLVEMLIGLVVTSIVIGGILGAILGTQRSLEVESDIRQPTGNVSSGLAYMERVVRLAGYGVDPRMSFEFAITGAQTTGKDNFVDSAGNFVSDDLAFRYRDPAYLRRGTLNSAGTTLTLDTAGGTSSSKFDVDLPANQTIVVICPTVQMDENDPTNRNGQKHYLAVKLSSAVASTAVSASVAAYGLSGFATAVQPCMTGTGVNAPFISLMYDVRLRVMGIGTPKVPYLVAFSNFGDPDANITAGLYTPIMDNVRDFQVSYLMNRSAAPTGTLAPDNTGGNANWVLGDATAEPLPLETAVAPNYHDDYAHPARFTRHPANIRGVRIAVTVFGAANRGAAARSSAFPAENSPVTDAGTDRYFSTVETAISVPNVSSRTFFVPFPSATCNGQADCNRWGG